MYRYLIGYTRANSSKPIINFSIMESIEELKTEFLESGAFESFKQDYNNNRLTITDLESGNEEISLEEYKQLFEN